MSFLRSKSEQLAEYLRDRIRRGELAEPLPGTRSWSERHGVVVVAPVPVGLIMTVLLQRGVAVPRAAEIIVVFHSGHAVRLDPPLARYPFPAGRIAKVITEVAVHYFDTGHTPVFHKVISTEIELPG